MTHKSNTRLHAFVEGRVQGVGFRYFVYENACLLNITGWVRNTYDERVEVVAEGQRDILVNLLNKLRTGPRNAFVTQIKQDWETATNEYPDFNIYHTV